MTQHLQRLKSEPNIDDQIKMKEDYVEKLTKDCGLIEYDHQPEKNRLNQRIKELEEQKVMCQKNIDELIESIDKINNEMLVVQQHNKVTPEEMLAIVRNKEKLFRVFK